MLIFVSVNLKQLAHKGFHEITLIYHLYGFPSFQRFPRKSLRHLKGDKRGHPLESGSGRGIEGVPFCCPYFKKGDRLDYEKGDRL